MNDDLLVKKISFKSLSDMIGSPPDCYNIIAGPCSVESYEQMELIAKFLMQNNVRILRGGAYKPRTSPYDFQGLGKEGLEILHTIGKKYNLLTISEILDPRDVELGLRYIDIIQIGSRNMQNYSLLKEVGKTGHPVLLKRGMMSTVEEFLLAAEYLAVNGNQNIFMCERGIRTFDTNTRNILDISCVASIKKYTNLPVVIDLSHSLGRKDLLPFLLQILDFSGIDGIMVELHHCPEHALSDSKQQLNFDEFHELFLNILQKKKKND